MMGLNLHGWLACWAHCRIALRCEADCMMECLSLQTSLHVLKQLSLNVFEYEF